jgi:hypothetical protein
MDFPMDNIYFPIQTADQYLVANFRDLYMCGQQEEVHRDTGLKINGWIIV